MKLRIAAETRVESGVEQCALPAGIAVELVAVKEALNALAVSELHYGEAGLLFEETTEA